MLVHAFCFGHLARRGSTIIQAAFTSRSRNVKIPWAGTQARSRGPNRTSLVDPEISFEHLLPHFATNGSFGPGGSERLVLERRDGAYVYDACGRRYIDRLSSRFCCQIGRSYGEAPPHGQLTRLAFSTNLRALPTRRLTDPLAGTVAGVRTERYIPLDAGVLEDQHDRPAVRFAPRRLHSRRTSRRAAGGRPTPQRVALLVAAARLEEALSATARIPDL
jgi:hypothetical protein